MINYLKSIWGKGLYPTFHKVLLELFGENLKQEKFVRWLAEKLNVLGKQLFDGIEKYCENQYSETRDCQKIQSQQAVYDMWLQNSIPSNDVRNGWNIISISKRRYLPHTDLSTKDYIVDELINKHGQKLVSVNKLIATAKLGIKCKLKNNNIDVS